jgi:hypothetical protein
MITPKTKGADAIIDAWLIEGVHPPTHQKLKKQLRREWPMLAKAIERLVNAEDSPENASANENREWALKAEKERDEARAEMAAIKAMLLDPVEVELDMIRGNIAIPERPEFSGVYDTGKAMANLIREAANDLHAAFFTMRHDWKNGDFNLPPLARIHMEAMECKAIELGKLLFRQDAKITDEALQSLTTNEISNQ